MDILYLANAALDLVAQGQILSIDDGTVVAKKCKLHIYQAIREVLESGYWKCAKKPATLAQLTAVPTYGWSYQYQLPVDYLRMYRFNDTCVTNPVLDLYDVQGTKLLTNDSTAVITYISDLGMNANDVGLITPAVGALISVVLAQKMAWSFQQSRTLKESLSQEATIRRRAAVVKDAQESRRPLVDPTSGSTWLLNRCNSTVG